MKARFKIGDRVCINGEAAGVVASILEPTPLCKQFRYAIHRDGLLDYWNDEQVLSLCPVENLSAPATQGRKDDAGKPAMHLLPWDAVDATAAVMTYGAERYGERNWEDAALSQERILAGAVRHISQHLQNKKVDESGKLHLAHAAASLLMALAKELRNV